MSSNPFTPNLNKEPSSVDAHVTQEISADGTIKNLFSSARLLIMTMFLVLPLFFTVKLWGSLGFSKSMLALAVSSVVVCAVGLMMLRVKQARTVMPISLGLYWLLVIVAFISAKASGDTLDAVRGSYLEVQTVGFMALLGLVMTTVLVLQGSKSAAIRASLLFGVSSALILVYNFIRIFAGPEFLSFGTFNTLTASPIGGFNDLAIFVGAIVIVGLITLIQLPLKAVLQSVVAGVVAIAVVLLSVINFFNIWLVVGFFSLLMLVYLLSKDSLFSSDQIKPSKTARVSIPVTAFVCIVSAVFVIAGDFAGNTVNKVATVDYAEVIPSLEGTIGLAKSVYDDSALLGVGPNRFVDAWRMYKDPAINNTAFWDTDFTYGSGYVPTLFINLGLIGGILMLLFHLALIYLGYKVLLRSENSDPIWYYIASVSFAVAYFIWGMSYVYQPGAAILLTGAMFTGMCFVAGGALLPRSVKTIPMVVNQRRGFFMMAVVIVLISNTVMVLLSTSKQYSAQASFNESQATAESIEEFDLAAQKSYELYPDDRFMNARAQVKLGEMNNLLAISDPTEADQQRFLKAVEQAQTFIDVALSQDETNPDNHAVLAGIYGGLSIAGVDGAGDRVKLALNAAKKYDPLNPGYSLVAAQMAVRVGDIELAKEEIGNALNLKPNFTQALYLSAQIDINDGNTELAIDKTRSIISLEPNNPSRYLQLGMLLAAEERYQEAISAFMSAISIDSQYANARYMLALAYISTDRPELALTELRLVEQTNPDNEELKSLINQLESGSEAEVSVPDLGFDTPVTEPVVEEDSSLLESVNVQTSEPEPEIIEEIEEEVVEESSETDVTEEGDTE